MQESLFRHLVGQFASKPENLATEVLCYVLERYASAVDTFIRFIRNIGVDLQGTITFRTQCVGSAKSLRCFEKLVPALSAQLDSLRGGNNRK
jgi:hypothetical protein